MHRLTGLLIIATLLRASADSMPLPTQPDSLQRPARVGISAHRAVSDGKPENTLAAIRAVLTHRVDYIEIDVRTTQDGHLVLMHDATLDRTTSGSGTVSSRTLADLKQLSILGPTGKPYCSERIPTLAEVAQLLVDWNRRQTAHTNLYVDCRDVNPRVLADVLGRFGLLNEAVFYGSDALLLALRGVATQARLMPGLKRSDQLSAKIDRLHPYAIDVSWSIMTDTLVSQLHQQGIRVFTDLLDADDNPDAYRKAARLGVDIIQTDYVLRVQQILQGDKRVPVKAGRSNEKPR